ncbi:MAG TPA: SGNH/GDSL hydrolase family protein [Polyangiaceae bacterium]|nr:SGNH/GDSL hydrolase family protein [Polyangiaceae bacterium]
MRTGFAIELLLCGVWLCACGSDAIGPPHMATAGAAGDMSGGAGSSAAGQVGNSGSSNTAGSAGTLVSAGAGGAVGVAGGATGGMTNAAAGSAGQPSGAAGQSNGGAGPVGPRFIGRFDQSKPDAPVFAWPGTAIALRFTGTAIGVTLSDTGGNVFEVVLDGNHTVLTLESGMKKYMLGTGLSAGAHDLLLYRRTEASFSETTFNGFDVPSSAYLPATVPTRRLEVIGDSISAGYGNEGTLPCQFTAATENHYLSYEAIAARTLNAELYTEAWSGIGMLHSYEGSTTDQMPVRYLRTLPERATSTWDFAKFVPHAVVINLGTNDFSMGDPGADFQNAYLKFVTDLRGHYPAARFFLAIGSMLNGDGYTKALAYLKAVIDARASAGDKNLTLLEFGSQDGNADGLGCDYHPSLKTHQKMADKLVAALKADMGW